MMPLTLAKAGESCVIQKITGRDEVRQHLAELGFVVDAQVMVVNEIAGNLIVQVKQSRIALDRTMAKPDHGRLTGNARCAVLPSLRSDQTEGGIRMKTLKEVKVGETATVARVRGEGPVRRRIMDMGPDQRG